MFSRRILVITGAGVSAESGIPTFRGRDGYWRNLDPAKLATPEAFAAEPKLVWDWYRERRGKIRAASPNPAHQAIARLSTAGLDFLLVTQNVDNLHARSGVSAESMVQIHGDLFVTRCARCDFQYREDSVDAGDLPECAQCGSLMRPGVVWFGEQLNPRETSRVERFMERGPCDVVLVVGTTAMFGYIVEWAVRAAGKQGRLIEINPDETPLSRYATTSLREPAGIVLPNLMETLITGAKPPPLNL